MPLPMVHLAIAVQMSKLKGCDLTPSFLLGSIAPDAIHMRPNSNRNDKRRTHLLDIPHEEAHERIRTLLIRHWSEDSAAIDFVEGYVAHLLTDYSWSETVVRSFRAAIPQSLSPEDQRTLYYQETDQIDFNLYNQMPWRVRVWDQLALSQPMDFEPLLSEAEIEQWRDRTLNWYGGLKQEPMIEPVYITDADVRIFIPRAAQMIIERFATWRAARA